MRAALLQTPSCCSYWAQAQKDPFIHSKKKIKHTPWLICSHQNNYTIITPSLSPLLKHTREKNELRSITFRTNLDLNISSSFSHMYFTYTTTAFCLDSHPCV